LLQRAVVSVQHLTQDSFLVTVLTLPLMVMGQMVKREPGTLGSRRWSLYARLYLRHFNELDHEFNAR